MAQENIFDWGRLGDLEVGRQNLGTEMPIAVYRLMQYTLLDELNAIFPREEAEDIFRRAGFRAGQAFTHHLLDLEQDFNGFAAQLKDTLRDQKIGLLKMEKADLEKLEFTLTIDEDLDCSGLPVYGDTVCFYDEGFLSGILTAYTKRQISAVEIDCWATGARTCRFRVFVDD